MALDSRVKTAVCAVVVDITDLLDLRKHANLHVREMLHIAVFDNRGLAAVLLLYLEMQ